MKYDVQLRSNEDRLCEKCSNENDKALKQTQVQNQNQDDTNEKQRDIEQNSSGIQEVNETTDNNEVQNTNPEETPEPVTLTQTEHTNCCPICNLPNTESKMLLCTLCNRYVHNACTNIPAYHLSTIEELQHEGEQYKFGCQQCKTNSITECELTKKLKEKEIRNKANQEQIEYLQNHNIKLQATIKQLNENCKTSQQEITQLREILDQKEKELNKATKDREAKTSDIQKLKKATKELTCENNTLNENIKELTKTKQIMTDVVDQMLKLQKDQSTSQEHPKQNEQTETTIDDPNKPRKRTQCSEAQTDSLTLNQTTETKTTASNTQIEKQKLCRFHIKGRCTNGSSCRYIHPTPQSKTDGMQPTTKICKFFNSSRGCQNSNCSYKHIKRKPEICRNYTFSQCRFGEYCIFTHNDRVDRQYTSNETSRYRERNTDVQNNRNNNGVRRLESNMNSNSYNNSVTYRSNNNNIDHHNTSSTLHQNTQLSIPKNEDTEEKIMLREMQRSIQQLHQQINQVKLQQSNSLQTNLWEYIPQMQREGNYGQIVQTPHTSYHQETNQYPSQDPIQAGNQYPQPSAPYMTTM